MVMVAANERSRDRQKRATTQTQILAALACLAFLAVSLLTSSRNSRCTQ
jgi:hypothetical protein